MGVTLHAALQVHFEATTHTRALWQTVSLWELGKDYALSGALYQAQPQSERVSFRAPGYRTPQGGWLPDEFWPSEADDCDDFQAFAPEMLPAADVTASVFYRSLLAAVDALGSRVRVLFWRC